MKLEVGQFVRTKDGKIGKYFGEKAYEPNKICIWTETTNEGIKVTPIIDKNTIVKASYNIIDILEVGDYVNGSEVLDFEYKLIKGNDNFTNFAVVTENCYLENTDSWIIEKNIKSVITHEQMEQMAYKVVE